MQDSDLNNALTDPELALELDDDVYNFIEDEVGRYDYANNWAALLRAGKATALATAWLKRQDLHYAVTDFIAYVTKVIRSHQGAAWSWDY